MTKPLYKCRLYTRRAFRKINRIRRFLVKLFDNSLTSRLLSSARRSALSLSNRFCGIFLLTFGAYSVLFSTIISLFTDLSADPSSVYGGMLCLLCSLPLLISKGNISCALSNSRTGSSICKYLGIRRESLDEVSSCGNLGYGFLLGVAFGALTTVFPFSQLIAFLLFAIMTAIILCIPETGLTFSVVLLFVADASIQHAVIALSLLSFILKLFRGKRFLSFDRSDMIMVLFAFYTLAGITAIGTDLPIEGSYDFVFFIIPYFLCVCLVRTKQSAINLMAVATVTMGALSALFVLGFGVNAILSPLGVRNSDLLSDMLSRLPVFSTEFAFLAMAVLIPVCTAFIICPMANTSRSTLYLSLASMVTCLLITEQLAFISCALITSFLLLLATGIRKIYFSIAAALTVFVSLLFAGSLGDWLFNYIYRHIYEAYDQAQSIFSDASLPIYQSYLVSGSGFVHESHDSTSFFYRLINDLGIVGFIIFVAAAAVIFYKSISLVTRLHKSTGDFKSNMPLSSPEKRSRMRTATAAGLSMIVSIAFTATFTDFYANSLSYIFLFTVLGTVSAFVRCNMREIERSVDSAYVSHNNEAADINVSRK